MRILRRKSFWLVGAVASLVLFVGGFLLFTGTKNADAANEKYSLSVGVKYNSDGTVWNGYGHYYTSKFTLDKTRAWCADASKATPASGSYTAHEVDLSNESTTSNTKDMLLWRTMYFGDTGVRKDGTTKGYHDVAIHRVLDIVMNGGNRPSTSYPNARELYDIVFDPITYPAPEGTRTIKYVLGSDKTNNGQRIYTYTFAPIEHRSITINKLWFDADDKEDLRPDHITFDLVDNEGIVVAANQILNDGNHWEITIDNLDINKTYTPVEVEVEGYRGGVRCLEDNSKCTLTNTLSGNGTLKFWKSWSDYGYEENRPKAVYYDVYYKNPNSGDWTFFHTVTMSVDSVLMPTSHSWYTEVDVQNIYTSEGVKYEFAVNERIDYGSNEKSKFHYTSSCDDSEEALVDGGTIELCVLDDESDEVNITNELDTVTLKVHKIWNDHGFESLRPSIIRVIVEDSFSDEVIGSYPVYPPYNADGTIEYEWDIDITLPSTDANGDKIWYTVTEEVPEGYVDTIGFCDYEDETCTIPEEQRPYVELINTPEATRLYVEKVWEDSDLTEEQIAVARPAEVEFVILMRYPTYDAVGGINGYKVESRGTIKVTKNNSFEEGNYCYQKEWCGMSEPLPIHDSFGNSLEYELREKPVGRYESTIEVIETEWNHTYYKATNSYTDNVELKLEKCWVDGWRVASRPDSVDFEVTATRSDNEVLDTFEVHLNHDEDYDEEDGCWRRDLGNKPLYNEGMTISYSIRETGYTSEDPSQVVYNVDNEECEFSEDNMYTCNFVNRVSGTTEISGTKRWLDGHKPEYRPDNIDITIQRRTNQNSPFEDYESDDTEIEWTKDDENDLWSYTVSNLPKYEESTGYQYQYQAIETWSETAAKNGAGKYVPVSEVNNFVNVLTDTVSICGSKTWVDFDAPAGARPESLTIKLYNGNSQPVRTTTLTAGVTQDYIDNCDSDATENDNVWYFVFKDMDKYRGDGSLITYTVDEEDVAGYIKESLENGKTLINTITDTVDIPVTKVWNDHGEADQRPSSVSVTITGTYGNEYSETYNETIAPADDEDTSNPNTWKKTFDNDGEGYPMYYEGHLITYTVTETLSNGSVYTAGETTGNINDGFEIINSRDIKTKLCGIKRWVDYDAPEGVRPESITVNLYRDGGTTPYRTATVSAGVTQEYRDNCDENAQADDNIWYFVFTNLDKYRSDDTEYEYTVDENAIEKYVKQIAGNEITNTISDNVSFPVTKVWSDHGEADQRPDHVDITITGTYGNEYSQEYHLSITPEDDVDKSNPNTWKKNFGAYPKYYNGHLINYTVTETLPNGSVYNLTGITGNTTDGFEVENTREIKTSIDLIKCWVDGSNPEARPNSLLFNWSGSVNGTQVKSGTYTLTAANEVDNCWYGTIENLDKYDDDNNLIVYTVSEDTTWVDESDYVVYGNNCTANSNDMTCEFSNKLEGTTTKTGTKTWKDGSHPEYRPDTIELTIYQSLAGGQETVYSATPTWTKSGDVWTYTYENLPLYNNDGYKYSYRVVEKNSTVAAKLSAGTYVSQATAQAGNFVNLLTGSIDYCGKKVWHDYDAPEDFRPEDITATLTRSDGRTYTTTVSAASSNEALTLCEEDIDTTDEVWYFVFEGLDKYDDNGNEYGYTLGESDVIKDYITTISQSTHTIYNDYEENPITLTVEKIWLNDDKDEEHGAIDVTLYRDGEEWEKISLSDENGWKHVWNLDGNFKWTVIEDVKIPNYGTEYRYETDDDGNIVVKIYNTKNVDTLGRRISTYVVTISGIALGGYFIGRKMFGRR